MKCKVCKYDPDELWNKVGLLVLPVRWRSQNEIAGNIRGRGGYAYRKYRKEVETALQLQPVPVQATGLRRVWFSRVYGRRCRQYDYANLVGGGKCVVDSLVSAGWLLDDTEAAMIAYYDQHKAPEGEHSIIVCVEEPG